MPRTDYEFECSATAGIGIPYRHFTLAYGSGDGLCELRGTVTIFSNSRWRVTYESLCRDPHLPWEAPPTPEWRPVPGSMDRTQFHSLLSSADLPADSLLRQIEVCTLPSGSRNARPPYSPTLEEAVNAMTPEEALLLAQKLLQSG